MSRALDDVAAERARQQSVELWTVEHDDQHSPGELALAACCYVLADPGDGQSSLAPVVPVAWPWSMAYSKPKDKRRNLVRAAALLVAEIERIDRADDRAAGGEG